MPRIITITSGKGGVGKTSISLNLALELASLNLRVCLFDADLGLANINILTGIHPENDLKSVINGRLGIGDIIIRNFQGIDIIPGSSGVTEMADLSQEKAKQLIRSFIDLEEYDYFIFDTSAGISYQVLSFCMASHEILLVITPEPTSLTDAYSLLKVLSLKNYKNRINVIVNQVKEAKQAKQAYCQLRDTVRRFLSLELNALGIVVSDRHVPMSVIAQTPFLKLFPDSSASRCIKLLGKKLISKDKKQTTPSLEEFWQRCLDFLRENKTAGKDYNGVNLKKTRGKKPDIMERLQQIETKLSKALAEIREIRCLVENEKNPGKELFSPHPEIELDFETWYTERNGKRLR